MPLPLTRRVTGSIPVHSTFLMTLTEISKKYNTKYKCIKHLEKVRWNGNIVCPHCQSSKVTPRKARLFFYHCNKCNRDFTVLYGTIFEASKMPLTKWFMLVTIMLNARKGISAKQISRDLTITYKTAWFSAMRVRCAMLDQAYMLEGIVEMDEAYIGGKPRLRNNQAGLSSLITDRDKPKRGRGTKKIPVVGIVERSEDGKTGRVVTKIQEHLTSKEMLKLLKRYVKTDSAIMMTDEARFYKQFDKEVQHLSVNHSQKEYTRGVVHTNTIEGFWSIVKNGIRGQYHVLSKKYLPFYLAEFAYKYNRRNEQNKAFSETINNAVVDAKCVVKYKPEKYPKFLAYQRKKQKAN